MANRQQRRHGVPVSNLTVADNAKRLQKGLGGTAGVVVAYPHSVGEVSARFHTSLIDLLVFDSNGAMVERDGRQVKIGGKGHVTRHGGHMPVSSGANIVTARNKIVRAFLEDFPSKPEWLWFIDSDMTFEPNILELLLESADPVERPIMGGLCFALMRGEAQEIVPTLYGFTSDAIPKMIRYNAYPQDQLVQVVGTGAACLLIHRTVLETMRNARWGDQDVEAFRAQYGPDVQFPYPLGQLKYPPPWPFFQETVTGNDWGESMSEDLTFCLRAAQCGFPVHVDTRAKTGHVKPVVIDEAEFFKHLPGDEEPAPTFVVIPVKGHQHFTDDLLAQLYEQGGYDRIFVYDNASGTPDAYKPVEERDDTLVIPAAGKTIHKMWNAGIRQAIGTVTRCNVAILNNDLIVGDQFLTEMAKGLRCHPQLVAVSGNYDGRDFPEYVQAVQGIAAGRMDGSGGLAGFAFMVRGEAFQAGLPMFDEQFELWYGDNDFVLNIDRMGGVIGIVRDAHVTHIGGGSNTSGDGTSRLGSPELAAMAERDRVKFEKKWSLESVA
jgi:GT2 family glycosyltransferase